MTVLKGEGKVPILFGSTSIAVGSRTHRGYLSRPDLTGEWPTVLVVPDVWGVSSSVKDVCRRIARQGFSALAPDLYRGDMPRRSVPRQEAGEAFAAVPQSRMAGDLDAIVRFIANPAGFWSSAEHGFDVLALGVGGTAAADLAARADVRVLGLVGCPIGDDVAAGLGNITAPILGIYGRADEVVPVDEVIARRDAIPHAEMVIYDGLGHEFLDDGSADYDFAAAGDALERLTDFYRKHLPPGPPV